MTNTAKRLCDLMRKSPSYIFDDLMLLAGIEVIDCDKLERLIKAKRGYELGEEESLSEAISSTYGNEVAALIDSMLEPEI